MDPSEAIDPDEIAAAIELLGGAGLDVDLADFTKQIETEIGEATEGALEEYLGQVETAATMHEQIEQFETILGDMESGLCEFRSDIGSLSEEIAAIYNRSDHLRTGLLNRKQVESHLAEVVERLAVNPSILRGICSEEPNKSFLDYLNVINQCHDFLMNNAEDCGFLSELSERGEQIRWTSTPLTEDITPMLGDITSKTVQKLRDHLLAKIAKLKERRTNVGLLIQHTLLAFKPFNHFIIRHHRIAPKEVRDSYVATMSHVYRTKASQYFATIMRLHRPLDIKSPVMLIVNQRNTLAPDLDVVKRSRTIGDASASLLVPHVEEEAGRTHAFDALFRSMGLLVMDIITAECLFTSDFFLDDTLFPEIIGPAVEQFREVVGHHISDTNDYVSLLICTALTQQLAIVMQKRGVFYPGVQGICEDLYKMFWGRFKHLYDCNMKALHEVRDINDLLGPNRDSQIPVVNPFCSRYADFSGAMLRIWHRSALMVQRESTSQPSLPGSTSSSSLNSDRSSPSPSPTGPPPTPAARGPVPLNPLLDDPLSMVKSNLSVLRIEFGSYLDNMAKRIPEKEQSCFTVNQLHHVLHAWRSKFQIPPNHPDYEHLYARLTTEIGRYCKGALRRVGIFKDLVGVKCGGEGGATDEVKQALDRVARQFHSGWQAELTAVCKRAEQALLHMDTSAHAKELMIAELSLWVNKFIRAVRWAWPTLNPPFRNAIVQGSDIVNFGKGLAMQTRVTANSVFMAQSPNAPATPGGSSQQHQPPPSPG